MKGSVESLLSTTTEDLKDRVEEFLRLEESVAAMSPSVHRMRRKVAEKDPDKRSYGPKMAEKVSTLIANFETVQQLIEEELGPAFEAAKRQRTRAQAAKGAASAEAEERRVAEEAQRQREVRNRMNEEMEAAERKAHADRDRLATEEEARRREAARATQQVEQLKEMVAEEEARCSAMGPNEVLVMGVRNILSTTTDAAQARAAAENLFNLVAAIASDPGEPRLRALRASNKDFQVRILGYKGGAMVLRSLGFVLLIGGPDCRKCLSRMGLKLPVDFDDEAEAYFVLEEPRAEERYEEWSAWMLRLSRWRDSLGFLVKRGEALKGHRAYGDGDSSQVLIREFEAEVMKE
eukprot:GHVU01219720.1.p1 GENE.GHVU01219720.1~~GHVU01219720.1.p1  ORF type:complete len:349 (-),score=97.42 GHVU01219720.1:312-1358(-)